jgi:hypothetical protein
MMLLGRLWLVVTIATVPQLAVAPDAGAAPSAELWPRWQAHDPQSSATVDHGAWADFLDRYVEVNADGVNRVPYGAVTPADRDALDDYVEMLAGLPISTFDRAEQMAYWINLYNALTLQVVLDHYPVDSIRDVDISPGLFSGLFGGGPWDKKLITIEDTPVSLNDIEHRILRPIWRDPRIHYAVNCASLGCPDLQPEPFQAGQLNEQLERAARQHVNDPRGAAIVEGELVVSSIYEWFKEDFGGTDQGVIAHLQRYAAPDLAAALARFAAIDDDRYDWRLNDAPPRRSVGRS